MEIISRVKQGPHPAYKSILNDSVFDGVAIAREIVPRDWLREGDVHKSKVQASHLDTTRYVQGPQVLVTRDDIRRTTW